MKAKLLVAHPLGNMNVREAARALAEGGLLGEFWTCLNWSLDENQTPAKWLPARVRAQLARRSFPAELRGKVRTAATWREVCRHLVNRRNGSALGAWLSRHESGPCSVDAVFRAFDRAVARRVSGNAAASAELRAVYAYEDGAAATFRAAGARGWRRLYDLPIGYWRAGQAIFAEEAAREPAWAPTLTGTRDSAEKLARKDAELAGADAVFVASTFTRETLRQAPALRAPVHVIPYGAPAPVAEELVLRRDAERKNDAPLRVLFAGSLGQRKGLSYLLEAITLLGPRGATLTLIGQKTAPDCTPLERAVQTHRWVPSLPHAAMLAEMSRHDVLVFPSLFEGFGLVILEAMSRGLPVIATAHTGAPDVFSTDGAEGFLVPVRSAAAIAEKLELLKNDRARLQAMRRAALARAGALRWEDHRRQLRERVAETLGDSAAS